MIINKSQISVESLFLLANENNPAGISARNLLTAYRLMNYEAVIPIPDTTLKSSIASFDIPWKANEDKAGIHVFPNPANDYTIVSYNMEGVSVLELLSQDGRVIKSVNLKPGINQHLFRTEGLPSGVYTLNLKGGNKYLTTKLIIR